MVGGIYEKSNTVGQYGARIFLVPNKQGITFVEECNESKATISSTNLVLLNKNYFLQLLKKNMV